VTEPGLERSRTSSGVPRGFFLTFEGIEGSGKSSHARLLQESLIARGFPVFLTREPGGTPLGEALRDVVLRAGSEPLPPQAELFLMLAARAQHVRHCILPRLDRGEVVLCDRYADASVAYQGGGRGLGVDAVAPANLLATGGIAPDLTVLFDLAVEDALRRVHAREHQGGEANRFDHEDVDFHEAVRRTYLYLARREPDRFLVLTTAGPRQDVARSILDALEPRLARRRQEGALA